MRGKYEQNWPFMKAGKQEGGHSHLFFFLLWAYFAKILGLFCGEWHSFLISCPHETSKWFITVINRKWSCILHNWLKQNKMAMKKGERPIFKAKSMASCFVKNFSDCSGRPNTKSLLLWMIALAFGHFLANQTLEEWFKQCQDRCT